MGLGLALRRQCRRCAITIEMPITGRGRQDESRTGNEI